MGDVDHAGRQLEWPFECGVIGDRIGVENDDVRVVVCRK